MSQSSQIYIRYDNKNKKELIANYYGWNYGERMISRARWGIEHIKDYIAHTICAQYKTKISRIFDTNFDMRDYQISGDIIKEWREEYPEVNFNNYVFLMQKNNDGKLLVDICGSIVKYAFLDENADSGNIMDAEAYMPWDWHGDDWVDYLSEEDVSVCKQNIEAIKKMAQLMSKEEVEEFLNYDYEVDAGDDIRRAG